MRRPIAILSVTTLLALAGTGYSSQDDRKAARAECIASLSGFPDGDTAVKTSIPADTNGFTLKYFASGCFGTCPAFTLTFSEGVARFEGHDYVRAKGRRTAKLTQSEFEEFLHAWYDGRFYAMRDDYCTPTCPDGTHILVTDIPGSSITLVAPNFTKQVFECYLAAETPTPPEQYFELKRKILEFAKAHRWL
jgi:hypothetical protein